jgi:hypothetical protein
MSTTTSPQIVSVEITAVDDEIGGFNVCPIWEGVDRPKAGGYRVRTKALADRLAAAMRAGAVFYNVTAQTDVNGRTFASTRSRVLGRRANADLRRLGF